jgi:hypothetical protein
MVIIPEWRADGLAASLAVIASEAKQSRMLKSQNWIASSPSAPRNDGGESCAM